MESSPAKSEPVRSPSSLLEIPAFLFGLLLAWRFNWTTSDMVWGLWLSSLFVGYATIVSTIAAGLYFALRLMIHKKFIKKQIPVFLLIVFAVASFLLAFFSLHFCGFHAGHAAILSGFFPLEGVKSLGDAFGNPPRLLYLAWIHLVPKYGLFLLSTSVAESRSILLPLIKVHQLIRAGEAAEAAGITLPKMEKRELPDPFAAPYRNVIKTHCLLFFFAFAHFVRLNSFLVFAVAYCVYFFPQFFLRNPFSAR